MRFDLLILASALLPLLAACGDSTGAAGGTGGTAAVGGTSGSGGEAIPRILDVPIDEAREIGTREYQLYVPSGFDLNEPTPLVLSFHGSTPGELSASVLQRQLSTGNPHAQENGYIIAYPQGLVRGENQGWDTDVESPDIEFVDSIVAELDAEFGLDDERIFAAGISNGGAFSYTLACTRGDVFAAIGPVAASIPAECPLISRIPAIIFHGTDDSLVTFGSGEASAEAWSQRNGCSGATEEVFQNGDSTCEAWVGCRGTADVEFCTVEGGGHTWPGSPFADIFEAYGVGKTTLDLDATDRMWEFFAAHPKPFEL